MKLSQYAKKVGVTYRTAFQWWKDGQIKGISYIVVEHKDRATRFGFRYLETFLQMKERRLEVVNLAETSREDLLADLTNVIYNVCAKLYGQRRAKHQAEQIVKQVEETCGSSNNI